MKLTKKTDQSPGLLEHVGSPNKGFNFLIFKERKERDGKKEERREIIVTKQEKV